MTYVAETIAHSPSSMIGMAIGGVTLITAAGRVVVKSQTRVPPNTSGIWEHHGRPYAIRDSFMRRLGIPIGPRKGDLYKDVEPGSHGHWPWIRSIARMGNHIRYSDLASVPIDNVDNRQHHLDGTVGWHVVAKRDRDNNIIRYERNGIEVPYNQLLVDAIYKARSGLPEDKDISAEHALEKIVVRTCGTGLKEVMQGEKNSHLLKSADAYPLLREAVKDKLFEYAVELDELLLSDTHFTDLMPRAVSGLISGVDEGLGQNPLEGQGIAFTVGERTLRLVSDPPTPA